MMYEYKPVRLDKKQIKAIRICLGYNDDLRIKLKSYEADRIDKFIAAHWGDLFGVCAVLNRPKWSNVEQFERYEKNCKLLVMQVLRGFE